MSFMYGGKRGQIRTNTQLAMYRNCNGDSTLSLRRSVLIGVRPDLEVAWGERIPGFLSADLDNKQVLKASVLLIRRADQLRLE